MTQESEQTEEQTEQVEEAVEKQEPIREPKPITILDTELEKLQEELKTAQEKHMLGLAESENRRKRMQREREELTKYAVEKVMVELLHPLDQFEQALGFADQMSDEVKNWAAGFQMILQQLKDVMSQHGVQGFEAKVGDRFDPHHHEAVDTEETEEHAPETILHQFVRGYRCGERTIRPARVKVAKAPAAQEELKEESKTKESHDD